MRKIIHVDMDAFYASVEQRDQPEYRGKPVVVGGLPNSRGVVATCSYEARAYGIHSAMPSSQAYRLCPQAIFIRPRMEVYRDVSAEIQQIFRSVTDLVEPLSLDEAYLDVTHNHMGTTSATRIAQAIRSRIANEVGLTASAGVSFNKFLAKIASDYNKPNGITVVPPEDAERFLAEIPIRKFFGVGKVTEEQMVKLGIHTGADLRALSRDQLIRLVGDRGHIFFDLAQGLDERPVNPHRVRKSIGREETFSSDIENPDLLVPVIEHLSAIVASTLASRDMLANTVVVKVKFSNFRQVTKRVSTAAPVQTVEDLLPYVHHLFFRIRFVQAIRLIGVSVQDLRYASDGRQIPLF